MILGSWAVFTLGYAVKHQFEEKDESCTTTSMNYVMQFYVRLLLDPKTSMYDFVIFQEGVLFELTYPLSQVICPMILMYEFTNIYLTVKTPMNYTSIIRYCDKKDNFDNQVTKVLTIAVITVVLLIIIDYID